MRKYLKLTPVLIAICFVSCCNVREALLVSKNFSKEYTGIDTLIRIDGYYYREDSIGLRLPIVFFNNREFKIFRHRFKTHDEIQNTINSEIVTGKKGSYCINNDTIKVKWIVKHELCKYGIFLNYFLIENDTTLRQIWYSCESCQERKYDTKTNDIYRFYEYNFDTK
jgi:hypothetical protein